MLIIVAACGLQTAGSEVAFLRDGTLYAIRSDGTNLRALAGGNVATFAWAPDHHSIVFRITTHPVAAPSAGQTAADAPGAMQAVSVNDGFPLQISPDDPSFALGGAWWDATGNRVLYRQARTGALDSPLYVVSQTDQPAGIARKFVTGGAGMPALSPDGKRVAVVNAVGDLLLGPVGEQGAAVAHGAALILPQNGRPARVLWQPGRDALLYDAVGADGAVTLTLVPASGGAARQVATVPALLDAAFSPDGALLLVRTPGAFALWATTTGAGMLYQWPESDPYALPWWSPDGKTLLVANDAGIQRVNVAKKTSEALLRLPDGGQTATLQAPSLWSPATAQPWSPDGGSIVFAAPAGATWRGAALDKPKGNDTGLYVASVGADSAGAPRLLDSGDDRAPAWGFADPATVFLIGAAQ